MRTRVLSIDPDHPEGDVLQTAGAALRRGELVAFPTETVYGLGANAWDPAAVRSVFAAKERPWNDPLIVHLADPTELREVVRDVPPAMGRLASFWPGPLTVILARADRVPEVVSGGLDTVAVRFPSHPVARGLILAAGVPVAAPSANRFSRPSPTSAGDVLEDLEGRIPWVLDGGATTHGVESTVIDLTGDRPALLRPGAVPLEALTPVLPDLTVGPPNPVSASAMGSPGMMTRHYSPRARVALFVGGTLEQRLRAMQRAAADWARVGQRVGVMLPAEHLVEFDGMTVFRATLGPAGDLEAAARRLFPAMRALDRAGVDVIVTAGHDLEGLGRTLQDRLLRAAEGRVIRVA